MALRNLGADFERYRVVEFDKYAIASYNAVHGTDFPTMDICDVHGEDLGIVDKDNYEYLLTYSFPCGLPGTKVKVENGYKNIEDVKVGDKVLTHNNRYRSVNKTMGRISPDYYTIKVLGYPELRLTGNHPVYILRDGEILWVKVKDITKSDMVCFNINTEKIDTDIDDEILWLLGRYTADGHINKYSSNSVNFSIGYEKENEFIEHIPDIFKDRFKRFAKTTVADYRIADKCFQDLCKQIGIGSTNKCVPQWIQNLPKDRAKVFLNGYFSGDGHCRKDKAVQMFCTVSKELFFGLQNLIAKIYGRICSCYIRRDNRSETFNDTYNGQFAIDGKLQDQQVIGNQIFTKVRDIRHIEQETPVYNFQVDTDESYTCENIVVHNCTDISIAGQMQGMVEGSDTRSSLLWEVRRILEELNETDSLPQICIMENVTAIHSPVNMPHFQKWLDFLESLGYSNFVEDLNASDYGIAQNRDRTFVVSLLGEWNYHFPEPIELTTCIEDYFEDLTDEQALQLVVKSEKALNLLRELDDDGKLE